ncbi:hypothetical protein ZEAMMB73_Zm00001d006861 [Zea mays]|uniref:Uncharacterized protein n=1 Tax=Zea mays TaxID=4577 RepID=A0A1D6F1E9_MAIZE|nr:hypothetical protein ZEAMMB73_Zm00001d006861 [Zea mays]ONM25282.1 hypothetical protein ZEAMMB73_Zm00001d006861 [Zea mays]ONM25284.1 hypothetical protein ZEAMMB73_Zm00001d006861 [Zea mays]ONM25292.1 hypothetical protein ZEAMMB73_Zm00001d006861 [Zea mays]ONM25294.1 hypothetical protein ZEAMMB73_Zm00001d006861 [Zea mays]
MAPLYHLCLSICGLRIAPTLTPPSSPSTPSAAPVLALEIADRLIMGGSVSTSFSVGQGIPFLCPLSSV